MNELWTQLEDREEKWVQKELTIGKNVEREKERESTSHSLPFSLALSLSLSLRKRQPNWKMEYFAVNIKREKEKEFCVHF